MKWSLSLLLFLGGSFASAEFGQLNFKGGTWNFATENVRSRDESASGVGAYSFELGYRVDTHWLLCFGFNLIMSDFVQGSSGYGLDLGARYYPLTSSGTQQVQSETLEVTIQEKWRPYFGLFMRQRIFGLAISTSYLGPGASLGLDYSLTKKWLLNFEARYDYLYGAGEALAKQTNFLIGLGYEF